MANATGSKTSTNIMLETTYGVLPASPDMMNIPVESNTLSMNRSTLTDNSLRSDRMGGDVRLGMFKIDGDLKLNYRHTTCDTLLQNMLRGAWTVNVLKAGSTASSLVIEQSHVDIDQHRYFLGCCGNTLTLSLGTDSLVPMTMTFIGKSVSDFSDTPVDSSVTASTTEPFDTFTGSISEGGSASSIITSLELNYTNNSSADSVLFDDSIDEVSDGNIIITGSLTARFTSPALYNKFKNETSTSISFTLTDPSAKSHTWSIPKVKYTAADILVDKPDKLEVSMKFNAQYDSASSTKISVTRTA